MCLAHGSETHGIGLRLLHLNIQSGKHGSHLLESHNEIHRFVTLRLFTLGYARTDKDHLCIRILLLGNACGIVHRRTGARHVGLHGRNMLVHQFYIRRAAGSRHKLLSLFQLLNQFVRLVADGIHRTLRHLDDIRKAHLFQCAIHLFNSRLELPQNGRSHDSHHLLTLTDSVQHVEHLRNLEDSSKWACVQALSAVDALTFVDVLYPLLILADGFHGTSFLARYRNVNDGMIRTTLMADTATDTFIMVNPCLAALLDMHCLLGTIHLATACRTSAAEVRNLVVNLHTCRTSFVNHTHDVVFRPAIFRSVQCTGSVLRQGGQLIRLVLHIESQKRQ